MTLKEKLEQSYPTKTFTVVYIDNDINVTVNGKALRIKKESWPTPPQGISSPSSIVTDTNMTNNYFNLVSELVEQI